MNKSKKLNEFKNRIRLLKKRLATTTVVGARRNNTIDFDFYHVSSI
jgi:hypothetical protein